MYDVLDAIFLQVASFCEAKGSGHDDTEEEGNDADICEEEANGNIVGAAVYRRFDPNTALMPAHPCYHHQHDHSHSDYHDQQQRQQYLHDSQNYLQHMDQVAPDSHHDENGCHHANYESSDTMHTTGMSMSGMGAPFHGHIMR